MSISKQYNSKLDKTTIPAILGILVIVASPIILQEVTSQELVVLETGVISTASKDYTISNNFDVRVFHDGELIRIKGVTASGHPYYAYQRTVDGEVNLQGKIFIDGKVLPLVKKTALVEKTTITQKEEPESVTDLLILINQPSFGYYTQYYNIIAKVFDSSANPLKQFEYNSGLIKGADVRIILTDPQGNVFRTFDGITNAMGYVNERFQWQYGDPVGKYNVTVVVDDGVSKVSKQFETDYKGYHPYYSASDNTP